MSSLINFAVNPLWKPVQVSVNVTDVPLVAEDGLIEVILNPAYAVKLIWALCPSGFVIFIY